ncbi:hypothetical protein WJX72_007344 [[Myrmecia] bisecta]|uniref:HSF-type DNA-binding domain-containing protein n=1 Tax=[Myrmecia] bisecta TaxID=41462 RepID=A0AAW1Q521_9CHLO
MGRTAESSLTPPPPFLNKTYELLQEKGNESLISWSPDGHSFVVWKPAEFARDLLPRHFKHNNFSSFVRQLNTYGFRKVDPDRWEFANECFICGRKDLLREIQRRKPTAGQAATHAHAHSNTALAAIPGAAIEVGQFGGLTDEVEGLKRDKNILMLELVRLRQQQQASEAENDMKGRKKRRATRSGPSSDVEADAQNSGQQLVQYQAGGADFSQPFLQLLQREGHATAPGTTGSDVAFGEPGMDDESAWEDGISRVDSAFGGLNIHTVPSSVTIKEHSSDLARSPFLDTAAQQGELRSTGTAPMDKPVAMMSLDDIQSPAHTE